MSWPGVYVENVANGETVNQRCILVNGQCYLVPGDENDFISISTTDPAGSTIFPVQTWPVTEGRFKALLLLSPGANLVNFQYYRQGKASGSHKLSLNYVPLLQNPPLHLAIMVAKDSPLIIDCPVTKRGGISSAHSDLNAAIAKFRMTAYMWQAQTAEDMHSKGLGRRSFRLEEDWAADTLSQAFPHAGSVETLRYDNESAFCSTAKIHIVRSEKTVAELRQAQYAQQNPNACRKNDLYTFFMSALKQYGGPFASVANPVVAGLILDSTYSPSQNLILAHAATAAHHQRGISLGIFGSHLTYSWPRFIEEVPACLLNTTPPGDSVGNDFGECGSIWEACAIGQGAFLQMVGAAFGASSSTGIMARGYAQHWPRNFLLQTAFCAAKGTEGVKAVDGEMENSARWSLRDALVFKLLSHFHLTTDTPVTNQERATLPATSVEYDENGYAALVVESAVGIVSLEFNSVEQSGLSVREPVNKLRFTQQELENRFERTKPLELLVLGMNGKYLHHRNVWKLFASSTIVRVPGSDVVLKKRAISDGSDDGPGSTSNEDQWDWAVLLKERGKDGNLVPATSIDMRVGCVLDGAIVHFSDRHNVPCGPRWDETGQHHHFGGHASERIYLSPSVDIAKVEFTLSYSQFQGVRMTLSDGTVKGELNTGRGHEISVLEPSSDEKIIGFYGHSDWRHGWGGPRQFGIITAPKDVELPDVIYDMEELKNTDGGTGPRPGRTNVPKPLEIVPTTEQGHDSEEENVDESDNDEKGGEEEQDDGEAFDTMEGEDFGPPGGLALRPAE